MQTQLINLWQGLMILHGSPDHLTVAQASRLMESVSMVANAGWLVWSTKPPANDATKSILENHRGIGKQECNNTSGMCGRC